MNGPEPDIIRDVQIFCLSLCKKKWTTTMRKQYVSAVHFVKHYTCHNKWWQTIQNVFNKHYFICLMHVCQMWTLWWLVQEEEKTPTSPHPSTHLLVRCPPFSPSLLPPPSLDASLRAAAARATGGGGTLVEGGRAGQSPGWDPGLGLRPLPPHHCKQPPLGYTSPPRPLQMLTMTDDMSSANCVESSAKQREQ